MNRGMTSMIGVAAISIAACILGSLRDAHSTPQPPTKNAVQSPKASIPIPPGKDEAFASIVAPTASVSTPDVDPPPQSVKAAPAAVKAPNHAADSSAPPIAPALSDPLCSSDSRSNSAGIYSGTNIGSNQIVPLAGKEAARIRSSPHFGSNVITCLLPSHTVLRTGETEGIWSRVQLGNGTYGWIATEQLKH